MSPKGNSVYNSDVLEIGSSMAATPPAISAYTNLPQTAPNQSNVAEKTRRVLAEKDSEDCMRVLTHVFGHPKFKGKQKAIVEAAYGGADVLVVAPTGMGKSLCFQIPAIADKRGVSVVVSPLLALMQNQIDNLRLKNVEVASLSSQVNHPEKQETCRQLQLYDTRIKLLYVTPERLSTPDFREILDVVYENHNLNRLVVDEAHCISEWGHDFREDYRRIGNFRNRYPDVPIMALTATATPAVQKDIVKSLKLVDNRLFVALHPFNRENLFYEIRYLSNPQPLNQMADIFDYITTLYRRRGKSSSGIVYCRTRKSCDELASYLRGKGLNARPYHRGIPPATLDKTLKGWTAGAGVDLVVATIAFGLGIDKGDVRYIIHYDMPKSFEGYYQETGRAGRDGNPSKCILYYSREDAIRVKRFVGNSSNPNRIRDEEDDGPTPTQRAAGSLEALVQFAESGTLCRHVSICRYFGEPIDENDEKILKTYCNRMCDICKYPEKTSARLTKLSSKEEAMGNVPPSRPSSINPAAPPDRQIGFNPNEYRRQEGGSFSAQKRPGSEFAESSTKKPKVTSAPILVTKPFQSASRLSKPFKPPSFVRAPAKPVSPQPPVSHIPPVEPIKHPESNNHLNVLSKRPAPILAIDEIVLENLEMEDEELSPSVDLPDVGMFWEAEYSAKASVIDREKAFQALRRSLHRVLVSAFTTEECWSKICDNQLDDNARNEIVFKTATELEASVISFSSTLEGYNIRIKSIRDDINALSNLSLWDSNNRDFEDSQEVISCLRRCSLPSARKGKGRAR